MKREEAYRLAMRACEETWNEKTCKQIKEALEQEPCEDIKAEIKQKREENRNGEYDKIFELCLLIIDKHTSGKEQA